MPACRCGCGGDAKASGYAKRGCNLRAIPPDVRARRAKRWARQHREAQAAAGRKGGLRGGATLRARSSVEAIIRRELNAQGECIDFPASVIRRVYKLAYGHGWGARNRALGTALRQTA